MPGDVIDGEVVRQEKIGKASDGGGDCKTSAYGGVSTAGNQLVILETDSEKRRGNGINRDDKRQRERELPDLRHGYSSYSPPACVVRSTPAAASFSYFEAHLACIWWAVKTPSRL